MADKPTQPSRRLFLAQTGSALVATSAAAAKDEPAAQDGAFRPVTPPEWVFGITRMAFLAPGEVAKAAAAGAQVVHTNAVWPYYPLRRDGGGLGKDDADRLRGLMAACGRHGMRLVLGLPPFPPVALLKDHPDWRVDPDGSGAALRRPPKDDDLGTRLGCNLG